MKFDWRTEDEAWGDDRAADNGDAAESGKLKALFWSGLLLLLILALAGWYLSQLAEDTVAATTGSLTAELIAAHRLLNQSVLEREFELFETFLSERNNYSRQLPLDLFRYGYFLDRPFLHLYAQDIPAEEQPQAAFSPDLTRAEVTTLQPYRFAADPLAGTIRLERLTLFRKEDGRWQLTRWPIDEQFWGETIEERNGRLTAEFPARDEDIGLRLTQDIGRLVDDICADAAIECPPNFRLKMLLVPYGQNLLDMNANYRTLPLSSGYDAYRIFLPAPTLVGRPVDEAGYRALYRGYAAWIAAVLVQHYSRSRPVTHQITAAFLRQWQLSPPPAPILPGPLVENDQPPPVPFPEQEIHLICQGQSPPAWIAYHPAGDTWRAIAAPENGPALARILQQAGESARFAPEGQGTLIRRPFTTDGVQSWRSFLWLGGLANELETAGNPGLFLADPRHQVADGPHLLFYPFDGQGAPFLAQTAACPGPGCLLRQLAGYPVWSPSGGRTLLTIPDSEQGPQLYLGDEEGRPRQPLLPGYAPQWLDEESFLYVEPGGTAVYSGRLTAAGDPEEITLLADIAGLYAPQILAETPQPPTITYLAHHPAQQDWLILSVTHQDSQQDDLLLLNRQSGGLTFGFSQSNLRFTNPFHISSDGRFLTIPAFEAGTLSGSWRLLVFDLDPFAPRWQYPTETAYFDWSADNQWLLIAEENALRLIAPRHDYERQIPHPLACHTLGWDD